MKFKLEYGDVISVGEGNRKRNLLFAYREGETVFMAPELPWRERLHRDSTEDMKKTYGLEWKWSGHTVLVGHTDEHHSFTPATEREGHAYGVSEKVYGIYNGLALAEKFARLQQFQDMFPFFVQDEADEYGRLYRAAENFLARQASAGTHNECEPELLAA